MFNVYDKLDKLKYSIVRLTHRLSNQSDNIDYSMFTSLSVRFARICNNPGHEFCFCLISS